MMPEQRIAHHLTAPCTIFKRAPSIEHDRPVAEIGVELARLELAEPHCARNRPGAGQLALLQVDGHIAGCQPVAVSARRP